VIVADTNLIAYLFLSGERTEEARDVFRRDPRWAAPLLWRSEFRNLLCTQARGGSLGLRDAQAIMSRAEDLFAGSEYQVPSDAVIEAALDSGCSAYDCEFAVLAADLSVPLVTSDARVLAAFGSLAVSMTRFSRHGY